MKVLKDISPTNVDCVIMYSPSCHTKPDILNVCTLKANSHHTDTLQQTSLLEFVGSVCYPCGVGFYPTEHASRYRIMHFLPVSESWFLPD